MNDNKPLANELNLVDNILDDALNSVYTIQQAIDQCNVCTKEYIPMNEADLSNTQTLDEIEMFINNAKDELLSIQDNLAWIDRRSLVKNH